jgi:hypothetical protein
MSNMLRLRRFRGLVVSLVIALMAALLVAAPPAQARDLSAGVKGLVLDAKTGKAVVGVRVFVMEKFYPGGQNLGGQNWDWTPVAEAVTGKSGAYSMKLPSAGTFRVFFVPADRTRYAMEAYPNAAVPEAGDDVVVKYGRTTSGISVKLDPSMRIEGHLYKAESRWDNWDPSGVDVDDGNYEPLARVTVRVCFQALVFINCHITGPDESGQGGLPFGEAVTDADGFYSIPGFKAFPFFAWANPQGMELGFDPELSSLMIDPTSSAFPDGVKTSDAFLQRTDLANITGRLVDTAGNGLARKTIQVWEVDQSEQDLAFFTKCTVTTDENGFFGKSAGDVPCLNLVEPAALLWFAGDDEFQGEFYNGGNWDWEAERIPVAWGWTTDLHDWSLDDANGP